jgi:hypothetical protein
MLDNDATDVFTAEQPQFDVLQQLNLTIQLDQTTVSHHIRFEKELFISSIETTDVATSLSTIRFYVMLTNISFLFCIQDIN